MTILYADAPATQWLERFPLGDGVLGAMGDGGLDQVTFSLNDATAWSGSPDSEDRVDPAVAREALAQARAAVDAGDPAAAEAALARLQSRYTQAYQPFATLVVRRAGGDGTYRRLLDLRTGVHTVSIGEVTETTVVERGVLVHVVSGAAVETVTLTTGQRELGRPAGRDTALLLRLPSDVAPGHEPDLPAAVWSDLPGAALEGAVVARVLPTDAQGRTAVLAATATTYSGMGLPPVGDAALALARATARLDAAEAEGVDALLARHPQEHAEVMDRVRLELPAGPRDALPVARRLEANRDGHQLAADPGLATLLFTYGRYLLWSSSRPGSLPVTLQGIWNDDPRPPWSSNYTLNINAQMAYWPAAVSGLYESVEPLRRFVAALADHGTRTARDLYGAPGWVTHHNSDAWAFTGMVGRGRGDARWAAWPMGGVWLAAQLWDTVRFGQATPDDVAEIWPLLRGAAEFGLAWLRRDNRGWVTSPATSPENAYLVADPSSATGTRAVAVDRVTACDLSLLRELFLATVEAADAAGEGYDEVAETCRARLAALPVAPQVAPDGTVVEWAEPRASDDPQHRHLSPLVGLYPGSGDWDTAHLAAAAKTLTRRGDDSSGWSLAWKLALWARLHRPDKVSDLLQLVFRQAGTTDRPFAGGLYPNLFAAHPPFQLDGNLGYVAALAECLVQSHAGIELLPSLPPELPTGTVAGLVARPGVRVGIAWRDGRLERATLQRTSGDPVPIRIIWAGASLTRTIDTHELTLTAHDFGSASTGATEGDTNR